MVLRIISPGPMTSLQDAGRFGFMNKGFSPNGAMDQRAFALANILCRNVPGACALEFCMMGPQIVFEEETAFCFTGAVFDARLNGNSIRPYELHFAKAGDELGFGVAKEGMFAYLAVSGGIEAEEVLGSASTNVKCGIGGFKGRNLQADDVLQIKDKEHAKRIREQKEQLSRTCVINELPLVDYEASFYNMGEDEISLFAIPGPQEQAFSLAGIETFYTDAFEVGVQSDRMGFRLEGPKVGTRFGSDIISDGIAFGAVQITNQGNPIIMLADRQTTGGYAKIATVASCDIPRLVQRRPGKKVFFQKLSVESAQHKLQKQEEYFKYVTSQLNEMV